MGTVFLGSSFMANRMAKTTAKLMTIRIPSILISKEDGKQLIDAVERSSVVVELNWEVPTDHVVRLDVWMSSASKESMKFLKSLAPKRRTLNEVMSFRPHYYVFSMPSTDPGVYNKLCTDIQGTYCAEDPDSVGPVTGNDVLEEDVRQLCIHELTKVPRNSGTRPTVEYAQKYWDYVEQFPDACSLDATDDTKRFGQVCSENLMKKVGLDVAKIQECSLRTKEEKLKHEKENTAWSPRAVRINGWRYSGIQDADLVTRAICSGYISQPAECGTLLKPRDPFVPFVPHDQPGGVGFKTLIGVLVGMCLLSLIAMLLYKRYLKRDLRSTLREEVMLEVQAQMGEYSKMRG